MNMVLHIAFDNGRVLPQDEYLFGYRGTVFKLVQNDREDADALLTLVPSWKGKPVEVAYAKASEFLSAYAWESGARVSMKLSGGHGVADEFDLRDAICTIYTPRLINRSLIIGSISRIADLSNRDQIEAATLYRDAHSSNHDYLAFLLYWHAIAVGENDGVSGWIDEIIESDGRRIHLPHGLDAGGKSLGEYLYDDVRNAIAHYQRDRPHSKELRLDRLGDAQRLQVGVAAIQELAKYYIRNVLDVKKTRHLATATGAQHSQYVNDEEMQSLRSKGQMTLQ